jgi:hypothetical protein
MHQSSRQDKNRTYKNYDSKSIKKGKYTRAHRSLRLLPKLERRLDSIPDMASPALLLLNKNLYKWRTTSRVWCVDFHHEEVFIGVNGTSTELERSVWCHVEAGRPSHMTGRLGRAASTDSAFSSSCRCVATKARAEPPQTLAGRLAPGPTRPGVWPTWSTC